MKTRLLLFLLLSAGIFSACCEKQDKQELVDYVNNRIGNISQLLVPTFPTTHLPNSMLRMVPTHTSYVTDQMDGFALNTPSHRQGDVLLLQPYSGDFTKFDQNLKYNYDQEHSTPYSYSVFLDDYNIVVNFAPSEKSAIYSFTFEESGSRYFVLKTRTSGELNVENNTISGYEDFHGIKHYFYLEFDKNILASGKLEEGKQSAVYVRFANSETTIKARYGISYINEAQAKQNLGEEITNYNLEELSQKARNAWNKELGKIKIEGGTENQKVTFYTALYRSSERMIDVSEDGKYFSAYDGKVHEDKVDFWVDDWVWDTHLALHPLQILLNPKAEEQKLASYIRMYEQSGRVPTFPCIFGDAHCMNSNHASAIFADAMSKGIFFDVQKAFEGMKHTMMDCSLIPWYLGPKTELDDFYYKNGWYPALHPNEIETNTHVGSFEKRQAVAVTTGASYDAWCVAQLAKKLGHEEDYHFFIQQSFNYRHLFNKATGFFHPKDKDGKFIEPFDYTFSGGIGSRDYYDENNGWTYNWDVQHNIADLVNLFGSKERMAKQLDQLFTEEITMSRWQYYAVQPDATGNVGQFVMGNEPSFHIPYLYNYVGQPWKTQKRIRMLMTSWFRNDLMGIPGDEDGGGMSAFYVFSALGFYPVTPGLPIYVIGSPLFTKSSIELSNGKQFTVIAKHASEENKYIQSAKLNGKEYNKTWFSHQALMEGGTLELEMGNRPNKNWGIGKDAIPPSFEY